MRASRNGNIWQHVDWLTIGLFLVLVIFGWLNIYGASYTFDQTSIFDFSNCFTARLEKSQILVWSKVSLEP